MTPTTILAMPGKKDCKTTTYIYKETVEIVEEFMKETRIREYCTQVCKGYCCHTCYGSKNACRKNEGRRLACSIFVCIALRNTIFPEKRDRLIYNKANRDILTELDRHTTGNPYFVPYQENVIRDFRISKCTLNKLKKIKTWNVDNRIENLIWFAKTAIKRREA